MIERNSNTEQTKGDQLILVKEIIFEPRHYFYIGARRAKTGSARGNGKHSRHRLQQLQRPWYGNKIDLFQYQKEDIYYESIIWAVGGW